MEVSRYYEKENVWLYAFDSASRPWFGANGAVRAPGFARFYREYRKLSDASASKFGRAVKILALHHHPLPVSYDAKHQRFLTLTDTGTLLGIALSREVDLILHGHEHVQARSVFRSTMSGRERDVHVVSVGSATKDKCENNWFNLIDIGDEGDIDEGDIVLSVYQSKDRFTFAESPSSVHTIPNRFAFGRWQDSAGYHIHEIASVTTLTGDGDSFRIVECERVTIGESNSTYPASYRAKLPTTTGYLDFGLVDGSLLRGLTLPGFHVEAKEQSAQSGDVVVHYGRGLNPREFASFEYHWWAVNAFAMDEWQFRMKYDLEDMTEWTHYLVNDPIEQLTVVVQFPDGFDPGTPEVRVMKFDSGDLEKWARVPGVEEQLRSSGALRYIEALNVASLRVNRPKRGYSYAIEWRVPPSAHNPQGPEAVQIQDTLGKLCQARSYRDRRYEPTLHDLLGTVGRLFRTKLIPDWAGDLDMNFFVFDQRKLVMVSSVITKASGVFVSRPHEGYEFPFGAGLCGKAFKTNEHRLFIRRAEGEPLLEPDYYLPLPGRPDPAVVLTMPLRNPADPTHVYGVIECSADSPRCPLTEVKSLPGYVQVLSNLRGTIDILCFEQLTRAILT